MRFTVNGRTAACIGLGLCACEWRPKATVSAAADEPLPGPTFTNVAREVGLSGFVHLGGSPDKPTIVESFGAGLALFDYDRDGDLDAYFTNGSSMDRGLEEGPTDALYVNQGRAGFVDHTLESGLGDRRWTYGVRAGDFDGDGWCDLYLTNLGANVLQRNGGDGTFADVTRSAGVGDPGASAGACYLDYDRDGDLDLYVTNYIRFDRERLLQHPKVTLHGISVFFGPAGLPGAPDTLYRNRGDGSFQDVSQEAGIAGVEYYGFQPLAFDHDLDGWLEVFVPNDSKPNLLWHNQRDGTFLDVAMLRGLAYSMEGGAQASMGAALGDFDGDLRADLYVTNFAEDYFTMYRGEGGGLFRDVTTMLGLRQLTRPMLGWACEFSDFDNDGDEDLFAVNGHIYPQVDLMELGTSYRQKNLLLHNTGDGRLSVPPGGGGPGFALERVSRGAAVGDIDNDGDQDILIGNLDDTPTLLRNDTEGGGRWIKVLLIGARMNRDAIGARVVLHAGELRALRLVGTSSGFLSSSDPRLHFGLGRAERVDVLEITWPDGALERFADLPSGQLVTIVEGQGIVESQWSRE